LIYKPKRFSARPGVCCYGGGSSCCWWTTSEEASGRDAGLIQAAAAPLASSLRATAALPRAPALSERSRRCGETAKTSWLYLIYRIFSKQVNETLGLVL